MRLGFADSRLIVVARIVLLALAASAVAVAYSVGRRESSASSGVVYACPMHPNVKASSPGDCPICRMALEPVRLASTPASSGVAAGLARSFTLPDALALRTFGDTSRCKRFDTPMEMRAPAEAETADSGVVVLHLDEIELLQPGERGLFFPLTSSTAGAPAGIPVHLTSDPPVPRETSTSLVRFRVDPGAALVPSQAGSLEFARRVRRGLVIRAASVIQSPDGPYVFVVSPDRRQLTRRPVVIGSILYENAAVISGLRENEYVAAKHTFFLDAEQRLRGATL